MLDRGGRYRKHAAGEALLGGVSRIAMMGALVAAGSLTITSIPQVAMAQVPPANCAISSGRGYDCYGATGTDAKTYNFGSNKESTPGGNASSFSYISTISNLDASGTIAQFGSTGGRGGKGDLSDYSFEPGAAGGNAGNVSIIQRGTMRGSAEGALRRALPTKALSQYQQGDPALPNGQTLDRYWNNADIGSLLLVYSQGGNGGWGQARGGAGGRGGNVSVTLDASAEVVTRNRLMVLWARSLGGSAGYGGTNPFRRSERAAGHAGDVDVIITAASRAETGGSGSPVIFAESLGGAGGDDVNQFSWGADDAAAPTRGGNAGNVTFVNKGTIVARGSDYAAGVVLQSIGGQGGSAHQYGFSGADAGWGGSVRATNNGLITTQGSYSFGLLAQSVGGAGGDGVDGGAGGNSANGGRVHVYNDGTIRTASEGSIALIAQSVGAGNALDAFRTGDYSKKGEPPLPTGKGGSAGFLFGWGGNGGEGGNGDNVDVHHYGTIDTHGDSAYGILAQSIGGGGGDGGDVTSYGAFFTLAVGGAGGTGGHGGTVSVLSDQPVIPTGRSEVVKGHITTKGALASGIVAQSIGGGGGAGGSASGNSAGLFLSASIAIGGSGGKGGNGDDVLINNTSQIKTAGNEAHGIEARSVGGGGGKGGSAKAYSIAVGIPEVPSVSLSVATGGSGGDGGKGGHVQITNQAPVTTEGEKAYGLFAQSIGGGGGSGGLAAALADVASPELAFAISVAIGGSGGKGGDGGYETYDGANPLRAGADGKTRYNEQGFTTPLIANVEVYNASKISTSGAFATGIVAQSVGGGGGDGGTGTAKTGTGVSLQLSGWLEEVQDVANNAVPFGSVVSITAAVGGSGGDGGHGKKVLVENFGDVQTKGIAARGIFAQSVGGGGGSAAGFVNKGSGEISISVGGLRPSGSSKGGAGGDGGVVIVNNKSGALIKTEGDDAAGIFAQSVGGGGGTAGTFAANKASTSSAEAEIADMALGAIETFQKANKNISSQYQTFGKYFSADADPKNHPFLGKNSSVQQIMKDAGKYLTAINAGYKVLRGAKEVDGDVIMKALGAEVYSLAKSTVTERLKKAIETYIKESQIKPSTKIPVKISASLSIGAQGGNGGNGGDVFVNNYGAIATSGKLSPGIFAQSVGGGGGSGGEAEVSAKNIYNMAATIGGTGGNGGKGGKVNVSNSYRITTDDAGSFGILAQSVGGGGGVGGGIANSAPMTSVTMNYQLGGKINGKTQDGDKITVNNSGTIETLGKEAHAIVAQSVGGGGGIYVVGRDKPISDATMGVLSQINSLYQSMGVTELSGVLASLKNDAPVTGLEARLGGGESAIGNGAAVEISHSGAISTKGLGAIGIFGQSVGAGGGLGIDATSSTALLDRKLTFGGGAYSRGDGGDITLHFGKNASIKTEGDGASAVFLQSIGGGGGYGGVGSGSSKIFDYLAGVPLNRPYESSRGSSGKITVDMTGADAALSIQAIGKQAHGIFVQSLAGGGGYAVDLDKPAPLLTMDSNKAQSRPTSYHRQMGPMYGASDRTAGDVKINTRGDIIASGQDANAIFVQSGHQNYDGTIGFIDSRLGYQVWPSGYVAEGHYPRADGTYYYQNWSTTAPSGGSGVVRPANSITHIGTLQGGTGSGAAIRVDGGDTVITLNAGSTVSALSGNAILTSFGEDTLKNAGTLIGNVNLASGGTRERNIFQNQASAIYRSRPGEGSINLGRYGNFTNYGVLDIGGVGPTGKLSVKGGDAWLSGVMLVDIDSTRPKGERNDWIEVSGATTIDGLVLRPNFIGVLPETYTLVSGRLGWNKEHQFEQNAASPISWTLDNSHSGIVVEPHANFTGAASGFQLTETERSVVNALQEKWDGRTGSAYTAQIFGGMASLTSQQEYHDALASISPEGQQQAAIVQGAMGTRASLKGALSCPAFADNSLMINETECAWAKVTGAHWNQSESASTFGYSQNSISYRLGAQWEFKPDWFLGGSAAFTSSWGGADDNFTESTGKSGDVSISLKHQMGAWYIAGAAHVGYGTFEVDRVFSIGDDLWLAETDNDVWTAAFRGRVAYEFAFEEWYLRPYLDLDVIHTYTPGYEVTGDGARMSADSMTDWTFAVSPTVEFGTRIDLAEGWLRPYASVGFTYFFEEKMNQRFLFGAENGDGFEFTSSSTMPDLLFDIGAGLQIYANDRYELRGEYNAQIGDSFLGQEGSVRLSVRF